MRSPSNKESSKDGIGRAAVISKDGVYRYLLMRVWEERKPGVAFCLLNPSTADADVDDPTVRRCVGFAKRWGFGRLSIVNLFAYRATDPQQLRAAEKRGIDIVGPDNDYMLRDVLDSLDSADEFVLGWGSLTHRNRKQRVKAVLDMLGPGSSCKCMGTTKDGDPRHPLYLSNSVQLERYRSPLWVKTLFT